MGTLCELRWQYRRRGFGNGGTKVLDEVKWLGEIWLRKLWYLGNGEGRALLYAEGQNQTFEEGEEESKKSWKVNWKRKRRIVERSWRKS